MRAGAQGHFCATALNVIEFQIAKHPMGKDLDGRIQNLEGDASLLGPILANVHPLAREGMICHLSDIIPNASGFHNRVPRRA